MSSPGASPKPYVSVAFVNRNDGYGGDLEERINKFIDYYAFYAAMWPGLFEFIICDWNPPENRPRLAKAFAWGKLRDVLHVEVPPAVHDKIAGDKGRKMLDYYGRNVALRRGRGDFSLVLNQDIFLTRGILEYIARRKLSHRCFYRADRSDFDFEPCRHVAPQDFEAAALANVFAVHRRHNPSDAPISVDVTPETINELGSTPQAGERVSMADGVVVCTPSSCLYRADRKTAADWNSAPWTRTGREAWHESYLSSHYHRKFFLHTNASGDFILAPRSAFFEINGMCETTDFYMHLDGYAIVQLFAAGYDQACFLQPNRIFHADHDRSGRADYREKITWNEHEIELSRILRNDRSYRLNPPDWGLGAYDLPHWRVGEA